MRNKCCSFPCVYTRKVVSGLVNEKMIEVLVVCIVSLFPFVHIFSGYIFFYFSILYI
jgi:hypothetical protein